MKKNFRKVLCCITAAAIIAISTIGLYGCEDTSIYKLTALLSTLANGESTVGENGVLTFESDVTFELDKEYLWYYYITSQFDESLDMLPDEMKLTISGRIQKNPELRMTADIIINDNPELKTTVYVKGSELYFELNTAARITGDLLASTGMIEVTFFMLFNQQIDYTDGSVLCFNISDFDFSYFDKYISYASEFITAESEVNYTPGGQDVIVQEYDKSKIVYFDDIKKAIDKKLTKFSGYRFIQLDCIMSTENGVNYLDIMATNEFGDIKRLDRTPIYCDLTDVRKTPESFIGADILPLRYIFELLGQDIEWNDKEKTAIITSSDEEDKPTFKGPIIKDRMYVNAAHLLFINYSFKVKNIGEYIEFTVFLNK